MTEHDRNVMLDLINNYLTETGWSARWLGLRVAGDARLVPDLARGQDKPARVMVTLLERLCRHNSAKLKAENAGVCAPRSQW